MWLCKNRWRLHPASTQQQRAASSSGRLGWAPAGGPALTCRAVGPLPGVQENAQGSRKLPFSVFILLHFWYVVKKGTSSIHPSIMHPSSITSSICLVAIDLEKNHYFFFTTVVEFLTKIIYIYIGTHNVFFYRLSAVFFFYIKAVNFI